MFSYTESLTGQIFQYPALVRPAWMSCLGQMFQWAWTGTSHLAVLYGDGLPEHFSTRSSGLSSRS